MATESRTDDSDDLLVSLAAAGDRSARTLMVDKYRQRLRRMVCMRIDNRIAARVDASDVVQEALVEAARQLPAYLENRPMSLYPWLRQLTWQRLAKIHRQHIATQKRSVVHEIHMPDESCNILANQFAVANDPSPSQELIAAEMRVRIKAAIAQMKEQDRDVIFMRYLEEMTISEIAEVMGISSAAVKMKHARALQRLHNMLSP